MSRVTLLNNAQLMKRISRNYTFDDACSSYLDHRRTLGDTDISHARRLRAVLAEISLDDISRRYIHNQITEPMYARGLSGSTVRRFLTTCQSILNHAHHMELTDNQVKLDKPAEGAPRDVWITLEEVDQFIGHCHPKFKAFATFLFFTGCRLGDALKCNWTQVHDGCVLFTTRKGKGLPRKRYVPLHTKVLAAIGEVGDQGYIHKLNGRGWHKSEVYPYWNHAVEMCLADTVKGSASYERFHGITPHGARHTFASLLIMNEVSERDVAELLGHSSMDMMKRYTHLSTSHLKKAILKLGV